MTLPSIAHPTPDPDPDGWQTRIRAVRRNEALFEYLLDSNCLPLTAHRVLPDGVLVVVGDVSDLWPWTELLGGEIHATELPMGLAHWSLHVAVDRSDGTPALPVRVSAVVLDIDYVVWDLRSLIVPSSGVRGA
ncbi:hypothetical protein ACFWPV_10230 [Streptomyces uncialis]|uniref:hypothetical protein n=1 Tax=Streptomyces uncialis TaxID=1048205 RepID=UPI003663EDEA